MSTFVLWGDFFPTVSTDETEGIGPISVSDVKSMLPKVDAIMRLSEKEREVFIGKFLNLYYNESDDVDNTVPALEEDPAWLNKWSTFKGLVESDKVQMSIGSVSLTVEADKTFISELEGSSFFSMVAFAFFSRTKAFQRIREERFRDGKDINRFVCLPPVKKMKVKNPLEMDVRVLCVYSQYKKQYGNDALCIQKWLRNVYRFSNHLSQDQTAPVFVLYQGPMQIYKSNFRHLAKQQRAQIYQKLVAAGFLDEEEKLAPNFDAPVFVVISPAEIMTECESKVKEEMTRLFGTSFEADGSVVDLSQEMSGLYGDSDEILVKQLRSIQDWRAVKTLRLADNGLDWDVNPDVFAALLDLVRNNPDVGLEMIDLRRNLLNSPPFCQWVVEVASALPSVRIDITPTYGSVSKESFSSVADRVIY
jgi:hypothetical protein